MNSVFFNKQLIYGLGALSETGKICRMMGDKALVVTGKKSGTASGLLDKLLQSLVAEHISYKVFDQVRPNPTTEIIDEGKNIGIKLKASVVIGLGGGSSLDTAKAISGMLTHVGSVTEYLEIEKDHKKISCDPIPMIAIPTTAGTGSEVTKNAVINHSLKKLKRSLRSEKLLPQVAILDPSVLSTAPELVLASSAMDALTQLIEPFTGKKTHPFIDLLCQDGMGLIKENITGFIKDPKDHEKGLKLQMASYFSGVALANAGLGVVHALARPFGGRYDLPHGMVCAILLPYITRLNFDHNPQKYILISHILGIKKSSDKLTSGDLCEKIFEMNKVLHIPRDFKSFSIPIDDLDSIIEDAQGGSWKNNPRDFTKNEIKELLLKLI
ncbi:MAG: iron-containing alcohol dehydrogenase [Spirochaetes bacterium]|nr:iron-containing alcohol dehydrogenase [Spirochaetota bacterium]